LSAPGYDCPEPEEKAVGARTLVLQSYSLPAFFYGYINRVETMDCSAAYQMSRLGVILWYGDKCNFMSRKRRTPMDVPEMVERWKTVVVGLALAHDKDEADRFEASVETCLQPILAAPIKQVREFAAALHAALKADKRVPFLVWRPYEIWVAQMKNAPDEDVKELKAHLAREIVNLVEEDVKSQLPEAMVRALMWRSPETLEEVRDVVVKEKAAGRGVRLKGRESCLFLEAGGTVEDPQVCVQV